MEKNFYAPMLRGEGVGPDADWPQVLEHIQAFPIPGGDSQIAQTVPVLFSLGMEGDHGAGLQPGFA
jgi:hypothetical protein